MTVMGQWTRWLVGWLSLGATLSNAGAPTAGAGPGERVEFTASCELCDGSAQIECGRCAGRGTRAVSCTRCTGRRKIPCPVTTCEKGRWPCPACGGEGMIRWQSGDADPCKVCAKKGRLGCGFCESSGSIDCPACERKGKVEVACAACFGAGFHPCPRCEFSGPCGACKGRKEVDCHECQGRGHHELECEQCYGYELVFCPSKQCARGEELCGTCHGSGKSRKVFASGGKAGATKCTDCKARGHSRCDECKGRGAVACKGRPRSVDCERCQSGRLDCSLCE